MVREWILTVLGLLVGLMFLGWSSYMLIVRFRNRARPQTARRVPMGFVVVFFLIGLADTIKATMDLLELIRH